MIFLLDLHVLCHCNVLEDQRRRLKVPVRGIATGGELMLVLVLALPFFCRGVLPERDSVSALALLLYPLQPRGSDVIIR